MTITLSPEIAERIQEVVARGDYPTVDALIHTAVARLIDNRQFERRVDGLLQEAEDSGEYTEMTSSDWDDIEREGFAMVQKRG